MQRFVGTVFDASGNPMSGVTVTVKLAGTGTNAALFSDNIRTALANPFTNDSNGSFELYAPNGRYDVSFAKTGATFVAADSTDLLLFDPADDDTYLALASDFLSEFTTGAIRVYEGLVLGGAAGSVALQTALKGGVLRVAETGGVAGKVKLVDGAGNQVTPFLVTADLMLVDLDLEKVGDAIAGTRRVGLSVNDLSSDPTDGIFVRQIDANNAFVVSRAASTESTKDLGQTLNNRSRVRLQIKTGEIRVLLDDVSKGTITTNIPAAALGFAIFGGSTASAGGIDIDRLAIAMKR